MIKFYRPNIIDLDNELVDITVTDSVATNSGDEFTNLIRNRDNNSGWATTGSSDAANTEVLINFNDLREFDSIMLVLHNFKDFDLDYWNGSTWVSLNSITDNELSTNYFEYDSLIESDQIRLTIYATQTADSDKFMRQFIVTEKIGTFLIEPEIEVEFDKQRKATSYLSGKRFVSKQVGGVSIRMKQSGVWQDQDLAMIERLYDFFKGFLVSISGGTISQFETLRYGYRPSDIFYVEPSNEYEPNWGDGRFKNGIDITINLVEAN